MALFEASAFLVLAIANGISVALVLTGLDEEAGMGLASPGQAPLYMFSLSGMLAAVLLIGGFLVARKTWSWVGHAWDDAATVAREKGFAA